MKFDIDSSKIKDPSMSPVHEQILLFFYSLNFKNILNIKHV